MIEVRIRDLKQLFNSIDPSRDERKLLKRLSRVDVGEVIRFHGRSPGRGRTACGAGRSRRAPMPIRIRVDPAARVRHSVLEGAVGDDELVDAYAAVLSDPDFDPTLNDLVDARGLRRVDVTPAGVRRLADLVQQIDRLALPTKVAVVAPDDVAYATARMYEGLRASQNAPAEHRVFRDMAEARSWLGLGPE